MARFIIHPLGSSECVIRLFGLIEVQIKILQNGGLIWSLCPSARRVIHGCNFNLKGKKMRKSILALSSAALLMSVVLGNAHAGQDATLNVTATVLPATCDISLSTNNLSLGSFTAAEFTGVATPIASSKKTFNVAVSNCAGTVAVDDQLKLQVSGVNQAGMDTLFTGDNSENNLGIMLNTVADQATYISNNKALDLHTFTGTDASAANGAVLSLQAGLASTSSTPDNGQVRAPIHFSLAYN